MKHVLKFAGLLTALVLMASCASRKEFVYLSDLHVGVGYVTDNKHEARVHRDDRLSIVVSSKNQELALPFNAYGGTVQVNANGSITANSSATRAVKENGYRVDKDGFIDFPILGRIFVDGLTVTELTNLIRDRIIEGNYIKNPLVSVEFLNFKYTVLGAVSSNGVYSVDGDRVTLLEAIAKAGDLTDKARIDRVAVIREEGDRRDIYMHDLRSKKIFDSPCFYLQQNDIVYVEPMKKNSKKLAEDRGFKYGSFAVSIASVVCSLLWVLKK